MPTHPLFLLGALLTSMSMTLRAAPVLALEQPEGNSLGASAVISFGGMQSRYVDPTSKTQAGDGTFTVIFTGIPASPHSTYEIQRSIDGVSNWSQLFAPGLVPDGSGRIEFHDPSPLVSAFYRLFISTDTRRVFTIRNTGTTDLTGIAVSVGGTDPANFELDVTTMETTVLPGATTAFSVTYVASDPAVRTAELSVTGNVPAPFTLTLRGGDELPPAPSPVLSNVIITASGPGTPAQLTGTVTGGPANGSAVLEASSDLGQLDPWEAIATIALNAGGEGTFGTPEPVSDPGSVGSSRSFYRLRP